MQLPQPCRPLQCRNRVPMDEHQELRMRLRKILASTSEVQGRTIFLDNSLIKFFACSSRIRLSSRNFVA